MGSRRRWVSAFIFPFLMGTVALAQRIPEPKETLGFEVGADYHLASYQQAVEYFKVLEQASPRMQTFVLGETALGRSMVYAVISSEENMAKLDHLKETAKKLSLVSGVTDEEARRLASTGKPIVYIDGGLHASECAPAQHNIQLAYDMVASEEPDIRFIRDNAVLVLVFPNPDGMDLLAEWYHPNIGTPFEVSPMPWLYNKYVGHDNNRDSFMLNQVETQHLTRLVNHEWYPVVLYNHHQPGMGANVASLHPRPNLDSSHLGAHQSQCPSHDPPLAELDRLGHGSGFRPRGTDRGNLPHAL